MIRKLIEEIKSALEEKGIQFEIRFEDGVPTTMIFCLSHG